MLLLFLMLSLAVAPLPGAAQELNGSYISGSGFFVSRSGEVVTNAHVADNCSEITLRGPLGMTSGRVVAVDKDFDLALIRTLSRPLHIAPLEAEPFHIQPGDGVQMIGFPGEASQTGIPVFTNSSITMLYGPNGEPRWLQFAESAAHGNSGGPLLDTSGVVVGVVTAIATLTRHDPSLPHGEATDVTDLAVSLPVLKRFLRDQGVSFEERDTQVQESDERIKELAEGFTVQVLCRER